MQDGRKEREAAEAFRVSPKTEVNSDPEQNAAVVSEQTFPKKKNLKKAFLVAVILLLVVCAAFACIFLWDKLAPPLLIKETEEKTEEKVTKEKPGVVAIDDEIRGVYIASVSNINFPSRSGLSEEALREELDAIVENSRRIGFDTVYFQARPSGDALYDSALFPTSRYLSGTEGKEIGFDPLAYLIRRASEYDMEVVAWVNPYRVTAFKADSKEKALEKLSNENFAKLHPEHTVFYGGKLYYDPASEEVRKLIADGVREICEGYDVAGILFDDYFYPYPVDKEIFDDARSYEASNTALSLEDWRRENVNKMVKATYDTVKSVSSELTFGISPFGIWK
ncbi:MAG: family 10 glycosylhydrolase, partial [Clostridia bacterium]|nr:family 10 glycosylhydrolase [Clostridia bacterium]